MGIPGAACACLAAIVKLFVLSLLAIIYAVVSVVVFFFLPWWARKCLPVRRSGLKIFRGGTNKWMQLIF